MAIEEFGKSLLADVRKRKEDQARKARKRMEKDALKGLAIKGLVGIGNTLLKDKADKFLESEQYYKENMQFKKGYTISNEYIAQEKEARNNALGYDGYWQNVASTEMVDANMTAEHGEKSLYNAADWSDMRKTMLKEIGVLAKQNHENGLENAKSFVNRAGEAGEEYYADFAKQSRPTTLKDLITNTVRSIGGKDLNVASREKTRKEFLGNAEAVIAYDQAWDVTANNRVSKFIADKTKQLRGKAPVTTQEYVDLKKTDIFKNPLPLTLVTKSKDSLGNTSIILSDENLAMREEEYKTFKQFNSYVTTHSTNDAASQRVQQVGAQVLVNEGTEEEQKFFNDVAKKAGEKLSRTDKTKAIAARNATTQANLAALKLVFREQYGMNEDASNRSAIAMYKNQLQDTITRKESGVLGAHPFNNAKVFGTMITMAQQQQIASNPRNFSNASIDEIADSPAAKFALFEDYRNLTDDAMLKYDELVSKTNNPIVTDVHNQMKGIVEISKKYPKIPEVGTLEKLYNDSLGQADPKDTLETVNANLASTTSDAKTEPRDLTLEDAKFFLANSVEFKDIEPEYILKANPPQFRKFIDLKEKQRIKKESDVTRVMERATRLNATALKRKMENDLTSSERRIYRVTKVLPERVIEKFKGA